MWQKITYYEFNFCAICPVFALTSANMRQFGRENCLMPWHGRENGRENLLVKYLFLLFFLYFGRERRENYILLVKKVCIFLGRLTKFILNLYRSLKSRGFASIGFVMHNKLCNALLTLNDYVLRKEPQNTFTLVCAKCGKLCG